MTTHRYPVSLSWQGSTADYRTYDRNHQADSGLLTLPLSADPTFRGDPSRWNPELLLVAAASSCQMLSFLGAAARAGIDVAGYADEAEGVMPVSAGPMGLTRILLRPRITVSGAVDPATVLELVEAAHQSCYIANSLSCPVDVDAVIEGA